MFILSNSETIFWFIFDLTDNNSPNSTFCQRPYIGSYLTDDNLSPFFSC